MKSFISQPMGDMGPDWVSASLPEFELGERLAEMDWERPCVEWWELPIRGALVDEVVSISCLQVSPGCHRVLRGPSFPLRFLRNLTAHTGGFGAAAVVDSRTGSTGRGMFYAGCTVELVMGDPRGLSLVRGAPDGSLDDMVRSVRPQTTVAIWDEWMRWVTGLSTFDLDHARVRRPPERTVYALSPRAALSSMFDEGDEPTRCVLAVAVEPGFANARLASIPGVVGVSWHRTPPERTLQSFRTSKRSFALVQMEGEGHPEQLDAVCEELVCDGVAVELSGDGRGVRWWDWVQGIPGHQGVVRGAHDFLEVWMQQAVALQTNPLVFSAPWGRGDNESSSM